MNFKNFFNLVKLESTRVARNKVVLVLLICFCLIMFVISMSTSETNKNFKVAIFLDGMEINEVVSIDVIKDKIKDENFIVVNSLEEGIQLVQNNKAIMFFEVQPPSEPNMPQKILIHYNQIDFKIQNLVASFESAKVQYTYEEVTNFLKEYGITLNDDYFDLISFQPYLNKSYESKQLFFSQILVTCIAIVLMFGLIYLISKDNETKLSKNLAYLPISKDVYLFAKIIPFILLGLLQVCVIFVLGWLILGIDYALNPLIILLISLVFIIAIVMSGFLFALCKSQISASLFAIMSILIPFFTYSTSFISSYYFPIQILLYLFPCTLAFDLFNGMVFGGIVLWENILIMLLQIIIYYVVIRLILNREPKNKKKDANKIKKNQELTANSKIDKVNLSNSKK